jgi:hypothetical protein
MRLEARSQIPASVGDFFIPRQGRSSVKSQPFLIFAEF